MSYDVRLKNPKTDETIILDKKHQIRGGTYAIGGTCEAWLNITYNYTKILDRVLNGGIRGLYGKTAQEGILILEEAINKLGNDVDDNYWRATEGNAKIALIGLLELAEKSPPEAIWDGD